MKQNIALIIMGLAFAIPAYATNTFEITNSGATDYIINGSPDPTLDLIRGETNTFNVNAPGHPFWIKTVQGNGTGNAYTNGVTGNGTQSGTITFVVPESAPDTLYYNCQFHSPMTAAITITDPEPATYEWDGGGGDDNWTTATNWVGDTAPVPASANDLQFVGSTRTTPTNDFAAGSDFGSIIFNSGASAFTISGNAIDLFSLIRNDSTILQTMSTDITLRTNATVEAAAGNLTISGAIDNSGHDLTVTGAEATVLSGIISGAGSLTKEEAGTLILSGVNTYSGGTTLNDGTLTVENNDAVGTGTLTLNGGTLTSTTGGPFLLTTPIDVTGSVTVFGGTSTAGLNLELNGDITGSGVLNTGGSGGGRGSRNLRIGDNLDGFNGTIAHNSASGGQNVLFYGVNTSAKLQLSGSTGGSYVGFQSADATFGELSGTGKIQSWKRKLTIDQSTDTTFSGYMTFAGSGLFAFTKAGTGTLTLNGASQHNYHGATTVSGGTLQLGDGGINGALRSAGGADISIGAGATFAINQSDTVTQGTDFSAAAITGAGNFEQNGSGTTVLTAANTYTGDTIVANGALLVNGSIVSDVLVAGPATVGGSGTLGGVDLFGSIAPGTSSGTLSVDSLTLQTNSVYTWEITNGNGVAGIDWDLIVVGGGTGDVTNASTVAGPFEIHLVSPAIIPNFDVGANTNWLILDAGSWKDSGGSTLTPPDAGDYTVDISGFSYLVANGTFTVTNEAGDLFLYYVPGASVATYEWDADAGADRDWNNSTNWTGDTLPGSTNDTWVNGNHTAVVANAGTAVDTLSVGDSLALITGGNPTGTVEQVGGSLDLSGDLRLGETADSMGTYLLEGGTLTVSNDVRIGLGGSGFMSITNGTLATGGSLLLDTGVLRVMGSDASITIGDEAGEGFTMQSSNAELQVTFVADALSPILVQDTITVDGTLSVSSETAIADGVYTVATSLNETAVSGFFDTINWYGNAAGEVFFSDNRVSIIVGELPFPLWDGGGADDNWTTDENWVGDTAPVAGSSNELQFAGSTRLSPVNDFAAGSDFGAVVFRFDASPFIISGNAIDLFSEIRNDSVNLQTMSTDITLGTNVTVDAAAGDLNLAGAIDNGGFDLTVTGAGATVLSGAISGIGGLVKEDTGTLSLSGTNTYDGDATIRAGTLQLGAADVIPDGAGKGDVVVNGTLDLNGFSETINGLSGAGTVDTVAVGTPTLTVGFDNDTNTFSGVIQETAGALALTKDGTGTLTLSGANTYTGGTTLNDGTLIVGGSEALGTGTLTLNGGTLTSTTGGPFLLTTPIDVTGSVTVFGGTSTAGLNLELNGDITGSGVLNTGGSGGGRGSRNLRIGDNLDGFNGTIAHNSASGGQNVLFYGVNTSAKLQLSGSTGGSYVGFQSADATFGELSGTGKIQSWKRKLTIDQSTDTTFSGYMTFAGSGLFAFTKAGTGTLTLNGASQHNYHGATTVSGGTLQLGDGGINGALRSAGGADISIGAGATFAINQSDTVTQGTDFSAAAITGAGNFEQNGSGTTVLTAANTYTGDTIVANGALLVNGSIVSDVLVDGPATVGGSGTLGGVDLFGSIAPGTSPGTLSVDSLTLQTNSVYTWEITNGNGVAGIDWDLIVVGGGTGDVTNASTVAGPFEIQLVSPAVIPGFDVAGNTNWLIVDAGTWKDAGGSTNAPPDFGDYTVDISGFSFLAASGTFTVTNEAGDLVLYYEAGAEAASSEWDAGAGADREWNNSTNWTGDTVPAGGNDVWINGNHTAEVTVASAGAATLYVGDSGAPTTGGSPTGHVLQTGGDLALSGNLVLGNSAGDEGTYHMTGGSLVVSNNLQVGANGEGVMTVTEGTVITTGNLNIPSGSGSGLLRVIGSASSITIGDTGDEDFTINTNGELSIVLDGSAIAPIHVQDEIILNAGSTLTISNIGSVSDGTYVIVTSINQTAVSGTFTVTNNVGDFDGGEVTVAYNDGRVELVVSGAPPSDPYDIWAVSFGLSGSDAHATNDVDGDTQANLNEYAHGGNPTNGVDDDTYPIFSVSPNGEGILVFRRRTDYVARNLSYIVERSTNLLFDVWSTSGASEDDQNPVDADFEEITYVISPATPLNVRLKIELEE